MTNAQIHAERKAQKVANRALERVRNFEVLVLREQA